MQCNGRVSFLQLLRCCDAEEVLKDSVANTIRKRVRLTFQRPRQGTICHLANMVTGMDEIRLRCTR